MIEPRDDADEGEHPVLYLTQAALFTWEQHAPGGCRCVCQLYHEGHGACLAPAEPGRLLRVVAPASTWAQGDITDALPICAACYDALIPLASTRPSGPD